MDTNTVQVLTDFGSKLDSLVNALSAKAGVAADHFYPMFVNQQVIDGWSGIVYTIFSVIFCVMALQLLSKSLPSDEDRYASNRQCFGMVVGGILGCVFAVMTLINLAETKDNVCKIYNPEYYAVQKLVQMVR